MMSPHIFCVIGTVGGFDSWWFCPVKRYVLSFYGNLIYLISVVFTLY